MSVKWLAVFSSCALLLGTWAGIAMFSASGEVKGDVNGNGSIDTLPTLG